MPSVSKIQKTLVVLPPTKIARRGAVEPPELEAAGLNRPSRTYSTLSEPAIEFTGGAAAGAQPARAIKLMHAVASSPRSLGAFSIGSLLRQRGRRAHSAEKLLNNLRVGHRVWPAKFVGQAWPREYSSHLGRRPLSTMGQPSIEGLANLRLQLSAAGAIMTAAAAEADR